MNDKPFCLTKSEMKTNPLELYKDWTQKHKKNVDFALILDSQNKVIDLISIKDVKASPKNKSPKIALVGMGFVGVTLATYFK